MTLIVTHDTANFVRVSPPCQFHDFSKDVNILLTSRDNKAPINSSQSIV